MDVEKASISIIRKFIKFYGFSMCYKKIEQDLYHSVFRPRLCQETQKQRKKEKGGKKYEIMLAPTIISLLLFAACPFSNFHACKMYKSFSFSLSLSFVLWGGEFFVKICDFFFFIWYFIISFESCKRMKIFPSSSFLIISHFLLCLC